MTFKVPERQMNCFLLKLCAFLTLFWFWTSCKQMWRNYINGIFFGFLYGQFFVIWLQICGNIEKFRIDAPSFMLFYFWFLEILSNVVTLISTKLQEVSSLLSRFLKRVIALLHSLKLSESNDPLIVNGKDPL
jgi:hypothetical protein